jgi:hypothetical protein
MSWIIKFLKAILDMFKKELDLETPTIIKPKIEEPVVIKPNPEPVKEEPKPVLKKPIDPVLWYPKAIIPKNRMQTQGVYRKGYPEGAVIHATAGWDRNLQDALNTHEYGAREGMCWITIAPNGEVIQGAPLNHFGSHAGVSKWGDLPGDRISRFLVGIEVCSSNNLKLDLTAHYSDKRKYTKDQVRVTNHETPHWGPAYPWAKFTEAQENTLTELLLWLHNNNPKVFKLDNVTGHHECAGKFMLGYWRKVDPGGSLSMPMNEYRDYLKRLANGV